MDTPFEFDRRPSIRSSWNEARLSVRKRLTDRKIAEYERRGFYSEEYREARRELWAKQAAKRQSLRNGNFVERDGRLIYSPL